MKAFQKVLVYVEGKGLKRCSVLFDDKIRKIVKGRGVSKYAEKYELPKDAIVLPGFIDQHVHGAGGSDGMDGTVENIATIANTLAAEGTTSFLVTTMTQSKENITNALQAVSMYREKNPAQGAKVVGVHLEGPFIAEKFKGAQPLEYVVAPDVATFNEYNEASGNCIRIVTLAPEVSGALDLVAHLKKKGIVASIGHTGAKFADIQEAVKAGASNVTHTYNAQSPVHHREVGVVGSAMLCDALYTELICDTIHVSIPAIKLLLRNKPQDKVILITDSMRAKGLCDGISELGGQTVYVKNGEARLENGALAGSVLRMNDAIRNLVEKVGVPFETAVDFATVNPATHLGLAHERGTIEVGKRADFTVLDDAFNVLQTIVGGKTVFEK